MVCGSAAAMNSEHEDTEVTFGGTATAPGRISDVRPGAVAVRGSL
jgi:hypothetical protein